MGHVVQCMDGHEMTNQHEQHVHVRAYFSKHTLQRAYFFSDFSVATCLASCLIFWAFQCRRAYKDVLIKKKRVCH